MLNPHIHKSRREGLLANVMLTSAMLANPKMYLASFCIFNNKTAAYFMGKQ